MGNSVCSQYEIDKVVCPPSLKKNVFTTSALDNIDHNPSSTTAQGSLHGTGISLFQHPTLHEPGVSRGKQVLTYVMQKHCAHCQKYTVMYDL